MNGYGVNGNALAWLIEMIVFFIVIMVIGLAIVNVIRDIWHEDDPADDDCQ